MKRVTIVSNFKQPIYQTFNETNLYENHVKLLNFKRSPV